jgi:hypothetical protein
MVKRALKDKVEQFHNVIAPNSFRFKKARKLVKKVEKEFGEVGVIYMSGSTASRRSMQDSSINLVVLHSASGSEFKRRKDRIMELARELGPSGVPEQGGRKWYFSIRQAEASKIAEAEGIIQPEMELLHGKEFANEKNLSLKIRSAEKRKSYDTPKQEDGAQDRQTNTTARKRTLGGIQARLAIEKQRKGK